MIYSKIIDKKIRSGEYMILCLFFLFGAFFIPDCFINRHITSAVFGVAAITIILIILTLIYIKSIQLTRYNLLIVLFTLFWGLSQYFTTLLSIQDQVYYLTFCSLLVILSSWSFDERIIKKYYSITLIVALLMSLWGIAQHLNIIRIFHT